MKQTKHITLLLLSFILSANHLMAQISPKEQLVASINKELLDAKQWDIESMSVDNGGSLKYKLCLNAECNPFVSWDFYIKNIKAVKVGHVDEYASIDFECKDGECIIPPGYVKGGRYEMKDHLQFIVKDESMAKSLVEKLNQLQKMDFGQ
ncbi:MAG TPA: hypothetical protein PLP34_02150 [Chitinophagaceae bacterium]|nr:hypothetical protein [Chitinophagaceae bacterium]